MTDTADWGRYNLPALWAMIKDENACSGADRVLSWNILSQQIRDQRERLLAAQDKLAEAWPPEKNASALIFQDQVTRLANHMNETLISAEDTRVGLQGIIDAIATAQSTLAPLVQQRQAASDDFIPRFIDHAEDDFDRQAQQAMRVAEAAIADHSTQINPPELYILKPAVFGNSTSLPLGASTSDSSGSGTSGSHRDISLTAVPVPVPVPHHPPHIEAGTTSSSPNGGSRSAPIPGIGGAPVLTGVRPIPPSTTAGTGGNGAGRSVTPPAGPAVGGVGNGAAAGVVIGGAAGLGMGGSAGGRFPAGAVIGAREQVPMRRGLPSGATIGADPSQGGFGEPSGRLPAGSGMPGREQVPMRRALPSGATIGAEPSEGGFGNHGMTGRGVASTESASRGLSSNSEPGQGMLGGPAGPGGRRGNGRDEVNRRPADVQWSVATGVPPIIEPSTKPVRHDPGPGVIGIDA